MNELITVAHLQVLKYMECLLKVKNMSDFIKYIEFIEMNYGSFKSMVLYGSYKRILKKTFDVKPKV